MERLDIPSTQSSPEDALRVQTTNAKLIQQGLDKLGINVLKSQVNRVVQNVSSTSYVQLTNYQFSVTASGGTIIVLFNPVLAYNVLTLSIRCDIDGLPVREMLFVSQDNHSATPTMTIVQNLNAGQHTIKFYGKVDGSTAVIGHASYDSAVYVLEIMKG